MCLAKVTPSRVMLAEVVAVDGVANVSLNSNSILDPGFHKVGSHYVCYMLINIKCI